MNGNILIVDDESASLKLLNDILSAEGHEVRPFNNGELALRSIMVEAPDLILLDVRMPGMNGFEVCRKVKESMSLKEVPVIFISAALDLEDKVRGFQEGGVDYITKPYQKEEVIARVKTHVALSHAMRKLKQIAESLSKSEESLKIAQSIAHLGHWEWDVSTDQFVCSEELCRILGLEISCLKITRDVFLRTVHPDDRELVANQLNNASSRASFEIEYRIVLPGGKVRVVQGRGKVSYLSSGRKPKVIGTIQELPDSKQMKILGVIHDITERKELEWQLEQLVNTDFLTGSCSRRRFLELMEQEFARTRRYGGGMSVLMLDLDHFKSVNDKHGHHIGDMALKTMVQICREILREVDVIGRMGGEEFAIMLPETGDENKALEIAERLRQGIAASEIPLAMSPNSFHIATSIGVASFFKTDTTVEVILDRADKALYKAKNSGRNRVCA